MRFKFRPLQLLPLFIWLLPFFAQSVPAKADVLGNWSYSQSQACNGSVEVVGNVITLHGPDYGGCSGAAHWVKIETTIPQGVSTVDFTWAYQTNDGASYDPPQYAVNGAYIQITQQNNATGSKSIPVQEGDIFTFRQYSTDSCCQPGHLTISNLSLWTAAPETTTTTATSSTTTTSPSTTTSTTTSSTTTTSSSSSSTSTTEVATTTTSTLTQTTTSTSTTSSTSTTTLPQETTTTSEPVQSTTTMQTTTTSTTTTIPIQVTTTTTEPYTPPQTTTTISTIETLPVTTITVPDTTIDLPDTTEPETSTTYLPDLPEEIVEPVETTFPEISVPDRVDVILPDETEQPEEILELPEYTTETTLVEVEDSSPTTLPFIFDDNVDFTEISDDDFSEAIDAIFDDLQDTEGITEVLGSFLDADISEEQFEAVLDTVFEDISDTEQVTAVITSLLSEDLSEEELVSVMESVFSEEASVEQMNAVVDDLLEADLSGEELAAVFDAVFDGDLSDEETIELAQDVLKGELDTEEFGTVIDAIFDEVVTDEVLIETFTAVLETELNTEKFEAIVNVLESEVISNEQVAEVVTLIIEQEGGVSEEQATELATSEKVLESIDGEQATEVFDAVVASEVSPEDGLAISEAVQEAPKQVRKSFEKELNVFEGVFDVYVPMGSKVPVGDRRVLVGVGAVLLSVPVRVRVG